MAGMDNRRIQPVQGWYDSLRETDDGRYTRVMRNEALETYTKKINDTDNKLLKERF